MEFKAKDRRLEGDTTLRQCQLVQLFLLEVFDAICKEFGLRYFLDFGTLLGAVRHGGAIPWDDDLDVSMPEDDYRKFLAIAPNVLPKGVLLQTPFANGGWFTGISRLRDCKSFYCESWTNPSQPSGIYIDIYPLLSRKKLPRSIGNSLFDLQHVAYCNLIGNKIAQSYSVAQVWRHALMSFVWKFTAIVAHLIEFIVSLFLMKRCWTQLPGPTSCYRQFLNDDIFPLKNICYEGSQFPAPNKMEKILEVYYGDWRRLPPESKRNPRDKMKLVLPMQAPDEWWAKS